jgi:hypothetical protein
MSNLDAMLSTALVRAIVYGPPKTRKTWWCGAAAEHGFNVIIADGENGYGILRQLSPAAKSRVTVLNGADELSRPHFAQLVGLITRGHMPVYWDQTDRQQLAVLASRKPDHDYVQVFLPALTSNDVFVCDSLSALVDSTNMTYAVENKIDMEDAKKQEWDGFMWVGNYITAMINRLKNLPGHVLLIGHESVYEKKKKEGKELVTEWSRHQLKSSSGPHAMTIPGKFSDILYFNFIGRSVKIDTNGEAGRDGGGRSVEPRLYDWAELTLLKMTQALGVPAPNPAYKQQAAIPFKGSMTDDELIALGIRVKTTTPQIVSAGSAALPGGSASPTGLSGLFGQKK